MNYRTLSLVYDRLMGDRGGQVDQIRHLLRRHNPEARSLVEFACGSGAVLKHLAPFYDVAGLDLSPAMLAIAKRKVRGARLANGSMTSFQFRRRFDIALCVFDSVNHLLTFRDWKRFFANTASHLAPNGIFLFDVNTVARLNKLVGSSSLAKCGRDYVAFRVAGAGKNKVTWDINVFKRERGDRYRLLNEKIGEIGFPARQIVSALHEHFGSVVMLDESGRKTAQDKDRRYFLCKLRA